jgi:hypothetical protein
MAVVVQTLRRILCREETYLDDAGDPCEHQGVSECGMNLERNVLDMGWEGQGAVLYPRGNHELLGVLRHCPASYYDAIRSCYWTSR